MTSNMSVNQIRAKLDSMNKRDERNIHITYAVGFVVEFLDAHIENSNGSLLTSVFHNFETFYSVRQKFKRNEFLIFFL